MDEPLYLSTGTFHYFSEGGYRLVLEVNQELANYYYALIPKWKNARRPRWAAHVTVVRQEKETPVHLEHWGKYEEEQVPFFYSPVIHSGKVYYWLNIFCVRLEEVRRELGLPVRSEYTMPPSPLFTKCFHCTIANNK